MMSVRLALTAGAVVASIGSAAMAADPHEQIFMDNCAACHQPDGKGIAGAFPALAGDLFVKGDPAQVIGVLLSGRGGMPSFKDELDDATIAGAISYVRGAWGNGAGPVTPAEVAAARTGPAPPKDKPLLAH